MSLREDIAALTAALHRFSCLQDRGRSSGMPDCKLCGANNCNGVTEKEKNADRPTDCAGCTTRLSDVEISAISMAVEGDACGDAESASTQQAVALQFQSPRAYESTFVAPPSSNTTALPCGDESDSHRKSVGGLNVTRATTPQERVALDECRTAVWERNRTRGEGLSVMAEEATQFSSIALDATATSSGESTALHDTPQDCQHQMEEAYIHILRKLLLEIHHLDARTKALSAQCEGERENWQNLQRKHEKELLGRNALIGALRQHLVDICAGGDSASAGDARMSSGSEWTLGNYGARLTPTVVNRCSTKESRSKSGAGTTTDMHLYDRPVVSSELCGMSSSSTVERSSRQGQQRTSEEVRRGSSVGGIRQGVSGDAGTLTHPNSLSEFQQQRCSYWGATRAIEEVATQTSFVGKPETTAAAATETQRVEDALEAMPRKGLSKCALGEVAKGNSGEANRPVQCATSGSALYHSHRGHKKRRPRALTKLEEFEIERNRRKSEVPATHVVLRTPGRFGRSNGGACQHSSGCGLCCRNELCVEACALIQRGSKGVRPASRPRRTSLSKIQRNKHQIESCETRELLRGIMEKHALMEDRLRIFQERLDKQEMGLQNMTGLFRDVMLPSTAGSQKFRPIADSL
ncbi:hypothetical protein TraAM80_08103 [Trypanosoma rangeli]|uniref:Uncharacterized protein n=1 Tax=Trypanosoma rangeli TaxID=5698 RepID=A0A422N2A2_TRYRA|nr:uncharacterized protein TraAM80_08103 [Trypanosoma rangeli]RNE99569.1 hypothetical protein TraAM80_08103 [Trypanosoma rangeli]|eukprot:RNE99569.1 hypothetical protein TraAM80_08103 [Trypanosoma rangeli]